MSFNILVVDDSRVTRSMISKALTESELTINEIHEAENGKEALPVLDENWIDLVLTDINMPEMNGMELVKKMSDNQMSQTIPVVVISTEGSDQRISELNAQGISGYIRKPFKPEELAETIQGILRG